MGGGTFNLLGRECSSENFNGTPKRYQFGRGSGRFQTLRGTIQKRTCRQHFNQFNEAKDNIVKYLRDFVCLCSYDTEEALRGTAIYEYVNFSSLAP